MAQDAEAPADWEHWTWVRLREALAAQQLKKFFGMPPAHICIVLAFCRAIAKIAPTIDDLLGGTAADSQLQSAVQRLDPQHQRPPPCNEDSHTACRSPRCQFQSFAFSHQSPRVAETVTPVAARSDERGSRLRPFQVARLPRRGQWTAEARRSPTAFVIAVKVPNGRMRGSQFSSCNISLAYRRYGSAPLLRVAPRRMLPCCFLSARLRFSLRFQENHWLYPREASRRRKLGNRRRVVSR